MDPFAAFSFAGTILEFTRFGVALFQDGRELYKSTQGVLSANEEIALVTGDLRALLVKLKDRCTPLGARDQLLVTDETNRTLRRIIVKAEKIAAELLTRLDDLKIKSERGRKWESIRKAVKTAWTKEEISSLEEKLKSLEKAVETNVLFSILETLNDTSARTSARFDELDSQTQLIISSLLENKLRSQRIADDTHGIRNELMTLMEVVRRIDTVDTDEHHQIRKKIAAEQVGESRAKSSDVKQITARFEMLNVSTTQEATARHKVAENIKASLEYPAMTDRYEDVVEAYPDTFEWVFQNPTAEQLPWSDLSEWQKTGSGVYWISGKAGSGKSTLMKHIFDDPKTKKYLKIWRDGGSQEHAQPQLCMATFFFWNSGSPAQKSQIGLLRALLHQVFSSCPNLIPVILPELWAKEYSETTRDSLGSRHSWTLRSLCQALLKLTKQKYLQLKLCFLIDGLDEFDGDHEELAAFFMQLTESPDIKICLSSRPWVIFQEIYHDCPSLRLQDLTFSDIKHYTFDKFAKNLAFRVLESNEPESALLLRTEVVDKAEGVFLWVKIVVKSLLLGIRQRDDITILRQRLWSMPPELDLLYQHLLSLIEPVYLEWASKAFEIVRTVRDFCTEESAGTSKRDEGATPLPVSVFLLAIAENLHFHLHRSNKVTVIEQFSSKMSCTLAYESLPAKCRTIQVHLTARCAGLLEIPRLEQLGINAPIQFLHRTARDFLESSKSLSKLSNVASQTEFDSCRAMLTASALWLALKMDAEVTSLEEEAERLEDGNMPPEDDELRLGHATHLVKEIMLYARQLDIHEKTNEADVAVLDIVNKLMSRWKFAKDSGTTRMRWVDHVVGPIVARTRLGMLEISTVYGLSHYVNAKLGLLPSHHIPRTASMLLYNLFPAEAWPSNVLLPVERSEVVSVLLFHGANPNWHPLRKSNQSASLPNLMNHSDENLASRPDYKATIKKLLQGGAQYNLNKYAGRKKKFLQSCLDADEASTRKKQRLDTEDAHAYENGMEANAKFVREQKYEGHVNNHETFQDSRRPIGNYFSGKRKRSPASREVAQGQTPNRNLGIETTTGLDSDSTRTETGDESIAVEKSETSNDVTLLDASPNSLVTTPASPPWPEFFVLPQTSKLPTGSRSPDLQVQMPPIPSFSNNSPHGVPLNPSGTVTPSSVTASLDQAHFGTNFVPPFSLSMLNCVGQHPSPIKKKISVKDYLALEA